MKYDFDTIINRSGTDCIKWEFYNQDGAITEWGEEEGCYSQDKLLPLWVADMDFPSPQPVVDALMARATHGIYGYTGRSKSYNAAVAHWMKSRHGWSIETDWIATTPGIVNALFNIVQAYTEPGQNVIIQPPVYHPFTFAVEKTGRNLARNSLIYEQGKYQIDFDDLEEKARDPDTKLAILCHPHNPVGRVWTREELQRIGEICNRHNVLVISDEVHGDLVYPGITFTPYAMLGEEFAQNVIVCTSPSKTFNLPGLKTSNILIPNAEIRQKFVEQLDKNGLYGLNAFGSTGLQAAYREGADWLRQVMDYLDGNRQFMLSFLRDQLPAIKAVEPEGTYLVWVDFNGLGFTTSELKSRIMGEAKVYLDDGEIFGPEGAGFARFNIACPRAILQEALERIAAVLR